MKAIVFLGCVAAISASCALAGVVRFKDHAIFPTQGYGYITIDAALDAQMFYGIRGDATMTQQQRAALPLVMFLQGGPGATSLFSDFLETGPTKLELANNSQGYAFTPREHAWTKKANMLYVDNPIGTGFSYTKDPRGFSTTDAGIATNLVTFLKGFLAKHTEFQGKDFWIFCESYGGKMTAYFGAALLDAKLPVNFKGVAIGDGWVDPIGCMESYGPYLRTFSQISQVQAENITSIAKSAAAAWRAGNGQLATDLWSVQQNVIGAMTDNINWYNSLYYYDYTADNQLDVYLNSTAFNQVLMFSGVRLPPWFYYNQQSGTVFTDMEGHFMDNGTAQMLKLVESGVQVHVYGGQLDLIVDTLCIQGWLFNLRWGGAVEFKNPVNRAPFVLASGGVAGFLQSYSNVHFWQINGAGHMVPLDQPAAAFQMFSDILSGSHSKHFTRRHRLTRIARRQKK